ncbi:MAG: MerR family transcriptional regulator [Waltera sp.]
MSSNEENGKSEKRLMSIGEVSKAIGITRRIILNYEAKGLLLPDKKKELPGIAIIPRIPSPDPLHPGTAEFRAVPG